MAGGEQGLGEHSVSDGQSPRLVKTSGVIKALMHDKTCLSDNLSSAHHWTNLILPSLFTSSFAATGLCEFALVNKYLSPKSGGASCIALIARFGLLW